jgi:glucoamylase
MAKSAVLGNGKLLIGLDKFGQVKDAYYHYAGLENHVSENLVHKIGVWARGHLCWLDEATWKVKVGTEKDTMATAIVAESSDLGLKLGFSDIVYNEQNIFIRAVSVENLYDNAQDIKIFFNQEFNIGQTHTGDTAYFDPKDNVVIHYKGRRVFLINTLYEDHGFDDYSVGLIGIEGKDGTYKDAEDGKLTKNPIEHGQVDSVIQVDINLKGRQIVNFFYWMCVGKSIESVKKLNKLVIERTPQDIIKTTKDYWRAWVKNQNFTFYSLSPAISDLFRRSLFNIRTHVSYNGAIIASCDSDMLQFGRDTYSYVWPRDASMAALALIKSGDFNASRRFFDFCTKIISPEGYFMHKYRPDRSLGSSWHPWVHDGITQLPIQEDETALVIFTLWNYFEMSKDLEFIESIYNPLIKAAAEFMAAYIDEETLLPKPSYDLWEMKYGISTFTSSAVYAALNVASRFAKLLGKEEHANQYSKVAEQIKGGILKYLYNDKEGYFYKLIEKEKNTTQIDKIVDISSVYGIYRFGVLPYDDPRLKKAFDYTKDKLEVKAPAGGYARFESDQYLNPGGNIPGNPWVVTTLWKTQYDIEFIKTEADLPQIVKQFTWVVNKAQASGVLSEQFNAYTSEQLSAAPLIWSHAEYVTTVVKYLEKLEELGLCKACYPLN